MSSNMVSGSNIAGTSALITNPSENDILFGRGASMLHWPGNVKFRELVGERSEEYVTTSCRAQKQKIAKEIIERVRKEMNGRFLIKASATGDDRMTSGGAPGPWVLAAESLIIDKAKQAIREKSYQGKKVRRKAAPNVPRNVPRNARSLTKSQMAQKKNPPRILSNDAEPASKTTKMKQSRNLSPRNVDIEAGVGFLRKKAKEAYQEAPNHEDAGANHGRKTKSNRPFRYDKGDREVKRQRLLPFGRDRQLQSPFQKRAADPHNRTTNPLENTFDHTANPLENPFDAVDLGLGRAAAVSALIRRHEEETERSRMDRSLETGWDFMHQDDRSGLFRRGDTLSDLLCQNVAGRHQGLEGCGVYPVLPVPYRSSMIDTLVADTYNPLVDSGRNPQLNLAHTSDSLPAYRPRANFPAPIDDLLPSRELANDAIGDSLFSGPWASLPLSQRVLSTSADQGGFFPAAANSREGLLEMLLQQRRLTESLLELRRQQEK